MPVWDAVNHVTGQCNTRLHHCAESRALQMIATAHIPKGQQVRASVRLRLSPSEQAEKQEAVQIRCCYLRLCLAHHGLKEGCEETMSIEQPIH